MKQTVGLDSLLHLRSVADELAELTNTYLEKGFSPSDIAASITDMFLHQLRMRLTPDAAKQIPRGGFNQPALDKDEAVETFCLEFSCAFMATVNRRLSKRHK